MAVLVEDSMCLMFLRARPQINVCNDNSSLRVST